MRILVVDDDPELAELVRKALARDGHAVDVAATLDDARAVAPDSLDAVVLDLRLPDGSGLELCRELRRNGETFPILLLTAQSAVGQRVEGLDAGADDYLVKPFAVAELRARVRALGRRRALPPVNLCRRGNVELDLSARRARRAGAEVELTPREWAIIEALVLSQGRAVSRERLLEAGWDEVTHSAAASLEVLIGRIRRKLGRSLIRTVRGHGYAFD
ncbi:MAG: response regulator transcription factor [Polyangiaceae bacterium]